MVNYMYVATCSHRRIRLSQLLGQTLVLVFSEYTKRRILSIKLKAIVRLQLQTRYETKASL